MNRKLVKCVNKSHSSKFIFICLLFPPQRCEAVSLSCPALDLWPLLASLQDGPCNICPRKTGLSWLVSFVLSLLKNRNKTENNKGGSFKSVWWRVSKLSLNLKQFLVVTFLIKIFSSLKLLRKIEYCVKLQFCRFKKSQILIRKGMLIYIYIFLDVKFNFVEICQPFQDILIS